MTLPTVHNAGFREYEVAGDQLQVLVATEQWPEVNIDKIIARLKCCLQMAIQMRDTAKDSGWAKYRNGQAAGISEAIEIIEAEIDEVAEGTE